MNEPRRLSQSGGISQRLLDSASLDKPSEAARRRAEMFAGTASSFSTTATPSGVRHKGSNTAKTLVTWAFIGAAASGALAFGASHLLDDGGPKASASAPPMAELPVPQAARPTDIAAEPDSAPQVDVPVKRAKAAGTGTITPWVPPVTNSDALDATTPGGLAPEHQRPSSASFADEAREIESAREAVSRGDNAGAIATLNQYDRQHPAGSLKAESTVLRVQALSNSGKTTEAKQLANEFAGRNPAHPLTQTLRAVGN